MQEISRTEFGLQNTDASSRILLLVIVFLSVVLRSRILPLFYSLIGFKIYYHLWTANHSLEINRETHCK